MRDNREPEDYQKLHGRVDAARAKYEAIKQKLVDAQNACKHEVVKKHQIRGYDSPDTWYVCELCSKELAYTQVYRSGARVIG